MRIESGTTSERRTRILIFLVLCVAFAGWFGYDGLIGYPAKNREWAGQAMLEKPDDLKTNPRAVLKNLYQIQEGMTTEELTRLVGEPALVQPRRLTFTGPQQVAEVRVENGKVVGATTRPADPGHAPDDVNQYVTEARTRLIKEGMDEAEVKALLKDDNPKEEPKTLWFVGPATYARVTVDEGKVAFVPQFSIALSFAQDLDEANLSWGLREELENQAVLLSKEATISVKEPGKRWEIVDGQRRCAVIREGAKFAVCVAANIQENQQHKEGDIRLQVIIAQILAVLAVVVAVKLVLIMRARVVLDDSGLTIARKHVPWDAITDLNSKAYPEKGWIHLEYRQGEVARSLRLDSYEINRFDEIVGAICEQKGYSSPIKAKGHDDVQESPVEPGPDDAKGEGH